MLGASKVSSASALDLFWSGELLHSADKDEDDGLSFRFGAEIFFIYGMKAIKVLEYVHSAAMLDPVSLVLGTFFHS